MPQNTHSASDGGDAVVEEPALSPSTTVSAPIFPEYYPLTSDRPRPSPPRRDPNCELCQKPSTQPCLFDAGQGRYEQGEILQIEESVHTPIDQLFSGIIEAASENMDPKPSMSSVRFYQDHDWHPRPGVAMEARRVALAKDKTYICLMATYLGIHSFAFLPPVLKHFCLPVSPHCEIEKDVAHLHTSPEWQKRHTWVITRGFFSEGKVLGRWQWRDENYLRTPDRSFKIDCLMINKFWSIEQQKWGEWEEWAAEKQYLRERYMEYKEFKRQGIEMAKKKRAANRAHSAPSILTQLGGDQGRSSETPRPDLANWNAQKSSQGTLTGEAGLSELTTPVQPAVLPTPCHSRHGSSSEQPDGNGNASAASSGSRRQLVNKTGRSFVDAVKGTQIHQSASESEVSQYTSNFPELSVLKMDRAASATATRTLQLEAKQTERDVATQLSEQGSQPTTNADASQALAAGTMPGTEVVLQGRVSYAEAVGESAQKATDVQSSTRSEPGFGARARKASKKGMSLLVNTFSQRKRN